MANIRQYLTGRKVKNVRVTPLTVDPATGAYTKGTAGDLCATYTFETARFRGSTDDVEISGANATQRNYVTVKDDFEVELTEIKGVNGQTFALNGWIGAEYFLAEAVVSPDGGTTTSMVVQAICKRRGFEDGYEEGKNTAVLNGVSCGYPMAWILNGATLAY